MLNFATYTLGVTDTPPSDEEEESAERETEPTSQGSKDLSAVRKEALDKLRELTSKCGKKLQDDDFDFDISGDLENLDLSSDDDDE